ncbi:MAG: hypothetical protein ACOC0Q_10655 [Wenzhouxiangella sp.]
MKDPDLRRRTITLFGLVMALMMFNGLAALFGLHYVDDRHRAGLEVLDQQAERLEKLRQAELHFRRQVQEWKNLLLRGHDPSDHRRYLEAVQREATGVRDAFDRLEQLAHETGPVSQALPELRRMHAQVSAGYQAALADDAPDLPDRARLLDREVRGIDRPLADRFEEVVAAMDAAFDEEQEAHRKADQVRHAALERVLIIAHAAGLLLLAALLVLTLRRTD